LSQVTDVVLLHGPAGPPVDRVDECGGGYYSEPFSKWFGRFLVKSKAKAPRTSFHSFRHSYRYAPREAHMPRDVVLALGGWEASAGEDDDYGSGLKASTLAQYIAKVAYPGLDLSHLAKE
jgi:hypothetical protein